jgi:hypothetical protein
VLGEGAQGRARQARASARRGADRERGRELLDMQRDALRMFTSCAWFFEDVGRIEPKQVLRYATRAIELAGAAHAPRLEAGFLERLAPARSSDPEVGTAADVFRREAPALRATPARVAASGFALAELAPKADHRRIGAYDVEVAARGKVSVAHRGSGRGGRYRCRLVGEDEDAIVEVEGAGEGAPASYPLADLTEKAVAAIEPALRRARVEAALTPSERERLVIEPEGPVLERALVAAVEALAEDAGAAAQSKTQARILALLRLLEDEGSPVPYEAQSSFDQIRSAARGPARKRLEALAEPLGFE